jgi:glycosyltransferase involved in cell wall biosynthesis
LTRPLVTIGITAFNAEGTITRALDSALAQAWRPVEIVVVDDASTDNTRSTIEKIAATHPDITLLTNPSNSGVAVSRNSIIEAARGEFVVFFDDDDVSRPQRTELQLERLIEYERKFAGGAPAVCHTAREQIYPRGRRRVERTLGTSLERAAPAGLPVAYRILLGASLRDGYGSCATCSQMARTETYRMVGGFDPEFRRCEDTDFCIRVARAGGHLVGISTPLVVQVMTRTKDKDLELERKYSLALLDKHKDLFCHEAMFEFCREWLELKHYWLRGDWNMFVTRAMKLGVTHPLLTWRRTWLAFPSLGSNRSFGRFHRELA